MDRVHLPAMSSPGPRRSLWRTWAGFLDKDETVRSRHAVAVKRMFYHCACVATRRSVAVRGSVLAIESRGALTGRGAATRATSVLPR